MEWGEAYQVPEEPGVESMSDFTTRVAEGPRLQRKQGQASSKLASLKCCNPFPFLLPVFSTVYNSDQFPAQPPFMPHLRPKRGGGWSVWEQTMWTELLAWLWPLSSSALHARMEALRAGKVLMLWARPAPGRAVRWKERYWLSIPCELL